MSFAEDSTGFCLLKLCPDCSGPKIKTSPFLLLFLEERALTRGEIFSCFCTNTLTCPSSAEFTVTSSRIWWTCKKCNTVWSFITVLKKCTRGGNINLTCWQKSLPFVCTEGVLQCSPSSSWIPPQHWKAEQEPAVPGLFLGRASTWNSAQGRHNPDISFSTHLLGSPSAVKVCSSQWSCQG